ncbi:hypothetical protein SLS60_007267 [Paraconiothyrium brasiliense]|uniref:Spindle and kinetochore-associated protein 3 n=1 Tax=Paraconiothyrium brasiliense TaxID=300254 RepID=A0ABR3R4T7_9PLEO
MLDPISASSLAGSIVTFCDFTYKVGKRVYELSQLQGELPADIQKCKEIAEILERATQRFSTQLPSSSAGQPAVGPSTLLEADLLQLFNQCTDITKSFLDLLEEFANAKSLSKVLKVVRKEGKLPRIHDDLDRHLLEIMYLLNGQTSTQTKEIKYVPRRGEPYGSALTSV